MRFARLDHYFTGVSIPVAALRTQEDCGVGEFADLPKLAQMVREHGLEVIQVLPVNDTGANSSPYSALSAYALHPLYLAVAGSAGGRTLRDGYQAFRRRRGTGSAIGRPFFSCERSSPSSLISPNGCSAKAGLPFRADPDFIAWLAANPWVEAIRGVHGA